MKATFREQRNRSRQSGRGTEIRFWIRTTLGMIREAPRAHVENLARDLRYSLRTLAKRPLFTVTAMLSLSIGIAATTTVFAVCQAAFFRGIPGIEQPSELVHVHVRTNFEEAYKWTSYPNYVDLRDENRDLVEVAGSNGLPMSLGTEERPIAIAGQVVTPNYFSVLGVEAHRGRVFSSESDPETSPDRVAVLSHWLWENRFGSDEGVIGRMVRLNGQPVTVVGVSPPGFRGHFIGFNFDVFVPASMSRFAGLSDFRERESDWVEMFGRLRHGRPFESAQAAFSISARHLAEAFPKLNRGYEVILEPHTGIDQDIRGGLVIFLAFLMGVSVLVLGIACANVATMLLSRLVNRNREFALRYSLGARRGQLVRQLVTENLVLALLAGGLGVAIAGWATGLAQSAIPALGGAVDLDVRLDFTSLLWALGISLLTTLGIGLMPALKASTSDLSSSLNGLSGRHSSRSRLNAVLVMGQVSLSIVVLFSAGLFLRSLQNASRIDMGFDPRPVLGVSLDADLVGLDQAQARELFREMLAIVVAEPEVREAAFTSRIPLGFGAHFFPNPATIGIPGQQPPPGLDGFRIEHSLVSHGYFETLQIPIREGRAFRSSDREDSRAVAVANETFSRKFFGESGPVGREIEHEGQRVEIVGVVSDSKYRNLSEEPLPVLYFPFAQAERTAGVLLVRTSSLKATATSLRARLQELAPDLPLQEFGSLEDRIGLSLLPQRVAAGVSGGMGLVAIVLSTIGLYGVLAYSVTRRSREIGIRISLGARPEQLVWKVVGRGLLLTTTGLLIGAVAALWSGQLLRTFLIGLAPNDPMTMIAIFLLLTLIALLASYIPARRVSCIDPVQVLRAE